MGDSLNSPLGVLALVVACSTSSVGYRCVTVMIEVLGQFCIQCLLDAQLGELHEQSSLANQVFRFFVTGWQFVQ